MFEKINTFKSLTISAYENSQTQFDWCVCIGILLLKKIGNASIKQKQNKNKPIL